MLELFKTRMGNMGRNNGEAFKYQSDMIMNQTFTNDVGYRKVFIQIIDENELNPGEQYFEYEHMKWVQRDAKYHTHSNQTISSDYVDYYLQFRPLEHYPVGRYVIVPDDTTYDPDITDKSQWWLIVGRNNVNQFVRYSILQCNWNLQWIVDGTVYECLCALRNANSYTSGVWTDHISTTVDNITGAWLPENEITKTIDYDIRFMISRNKKYPKIFKSSKILDTFPQGIIKLTFKQDVYDKHTDYVNENGIGGICDYYSSPIIPDDYKEKTIKNGTSEILLAKGINSNIPIGGNYKQFKYIAYNNNGEEIQIVPEWNFKSIDNSKFTTEIDENTGYFKIKADYDLKLIGTTVIIQLSEKDTGNYSSILEVEVRS